MPDRSERPRSECAVAGTLDIVGDRWSLLIVRDLLMSQELRYADLAAGAEAIPTNTLAERLKRLESAGIVERLPYSEHPPRYAYRLTTRGRALGPVVDAIATWGVANLPGTRRLGVSSPAIGSDDPGLSEAMGNVG